MGHIGPEHPAVIQYRNEKRPTIDADIEELRLNLEKLLKENSSQHSPDQITVSNRYGVFGGKDFYPRGGFFDLMGMFDTINECGDILRDCLQKYKENPLYNTALDWWQIVDLTTGQELACKDSSKPSLQTAEEYHVVYQDGNLVKVHDTQEYKDDANYFD